MSHISRRVWVALAPPCRGLDRLATTPTGPHARTLIKEHVKVKLQLRSFREFLVRRRRGGAVGKFHCRNG